MISVTIDDKDEERLELIIHGHGETTHCAAVSCLSQTFIKCCMDSGCEVTGHMRTGDIEVRVDNKSTVVPYLNYLITGVRLLESHCNDVTLTLK